MNYEQEERVEASIPVQSRVHIVELANLNIYFEREGYRARSMSGLVDMCVQLLCEILRANDKLPVEIGTIAEAHNYLISVKMYQPSMRNRSYKKVSTAIRFEGMREEGLDPKFNDPHGYKVIHEKDYIERPIIKLSQEEAYRAFTKRKMIEEERGCQISDDEYYEIKAEIARQESEKIKKTAIEAARARGMIKEEPATYKSKTREEVAAYEKEIEERDKERRKLENAPVDPSQFKVVKGE